MATNRPLTPDEQQRIRDMHAAGTSLHAIAKELGRAKDTIWKFANREGLTWDQTRTQAATQRLVADARERRAELANLLLEDALRLRRQMWTPTKVFNIGGKDNVYTEHEMPEPPFRDKRDIMQAISTAVGSAVKLEDHDTGAEDGKSMLTDLAVGLARLYHEQRDAEPEPE